MCHPRESAHSSCILFRYYVYFKWFMRHPVLRWWIEKVYDRAWMSRSVLVVGDAADVYWWDGGDCHPWW